MNSRELALVSTATVFGALASAFAFRIFLNPKKKQFPQTHNGVVSTKASPNPFDPSKRKESVWFCFFQFHVDFPQCFILHLLFAFRNFIYFRYLSWDDYFMAIAFLSAERSKDPNRQVIHFNLCVFVRNNLKIMLIDNIDYVI